MEAWEKEFEAPGEYCGEAGWVECRRGQMPVGTRQVDDVDFLEQLESFDPDADVLFNPRRGVWSVYRVKHYGASEADDLILHEFDLGADPGFWVLNEMRKRALVRPGETSSDPKIAGREWLRKLRDSMKVRRERRQREWRNFMADIRKQMNTYLVRKRTSDVSTRFEHKKKHHAGVLPGAPRVSLYVPGPEPRPAVKFDQRTGLFKPVSA